MPTQKAPRRAGARWREGAPPYILDCFDSKGATADRYTVLFCAPFADTGGEVLYLGLGEGGRGVSMFGSMPPHQAAAYRYRVKHHRVRWLDLSPETRAHIVARWEES